MTAIRFDTPPAALTESNAVRRVFSEMQGADDSSVVLAGWRSFALAVRGRRTVCYEVRFP